MIPGCTIIATVVAKPETRQELREILAAQVSPTRAEDGCVTYDFLVDANDPCVFVFYENWRTQDDLTEHLSKPHLKPLLDRKGELLAKPVDILHLNILSEMDS